MILYLYALADGIERVEDATGVCGETPMVLPLPHCALVAGWIDAAPAIDRNALTRQDVLVRHVHEIARAALPMRFGTTAASIDAATRAIEGLGTAVRERLNLVAGREQMTVRIAGPPSRPEAASARSRRSSPETERAEADASRASDPSKARHASGALGTVGDGTRYLERRAGRELPDGIRELLQALEPLARATRVEPGLRSGVTTAYQLIDRGTADRHRKLIEEIAAQHPALRVRASGPLPPYAFADLGRPR